MKGHKGRFIVLPFSGCLSQPSAAVGGDRTERPTPETSRTKKGRNEKEESCKERMKRIMSSLKTFSAFFVYKDEIEEEEREMEIGYPTDVKHLTHIGMDGKITTNEAPSQLISFPTISLGQFEIAMSAQSTHHSLVLNSSKS